MNISNLFNTIVLFQHNTGERVLGDYFGILGFKIRMEIDSEDLMDVSRYKVSYYKPYFRPPEGFKVVCVTDNPYRRILSKYKEISHVNWSLKKYSKDYLSEKFNNWLTPLIANDFYLLETDWRTTINSYIYLYPYDFTQFTPDESIRLDNYREDLSKIDFLHKMNINFDEYKQYDVSDSYKDVWSYENARIIYRKHRHIFDFYGYDPFSFTSKGLSEKEKVDFIHNM